jgi:uncharacterized protein YqjF (DUF2071 family)
MRQVWKDLLFAHWSVPKEALQDRLPPGLELDTFEGRAYVGITPFELTGLRLRGLPPVPLLSRFPEVNLRTYVKCDGLPGIYFLSLDAGRALAVVGSRLAFFLPYHYALARIERSSESVTFSSTRISPRTGGASFEAAYRPVGPAFTPGEDTLESWFSERYCYFTPGPDGKVWRCEIKHRPWRLYQAEGAITRNTLADAADLDLPGDGPILHYARRQDVSVWSIEEENAISGPRNPHRSHRTAR